MRNRNRSFRVTAAVAIVGQILLPPAFAQPAPPLPTPVGPATPAPTADPPARVGRLASLNGTVSFHTQDATEWSPAAVNYPVAAGNAFWTDANSEADIDISASRIALAPTTELDIPTLDDTTFQGVLPQGEIYARLRPAAPGETYAVQTPRGLVTFAVPGRYAVTAGDTATPTTVIVVDGSAQVTGPNLSLQVGPGQMATINGTDQFTGSIGPAQRDPFLTAMLDRERPPPAQAVAPPPAVAAMPGGTELAAYGTWAESPNYGRVWYPQVSSGWVPYRDGNWSYVAPWGWTWVDSEPWGFAPFHYGRWAEVDGRWGWIPGGGEVVAQPVYAPALVAFFGIGVGAAVGVGIGAALAGGNIGWCPLGPGEAYHPWYRASPTYVRNVNITHVTNVTNITTINRNVTINNFINRGATTVVPSSALTASRPIRQAVLRSDPATFAQARPLIGQEPLRPTMATAGITPRVARTMNLQPGPGPVRQAAPGPAIHPAAAGLAAAPGLGQPSPTPHNAGPMGIHPAGTAPPLVAPGNRPNLASPANLPAGGHEAAAPGAPGAPPTMTHPNAPIGNPGAPGVPPSVANRPAGMAPLLAHPGPPTQPMGQPGGPATAAIHPPAPTPQAHPGGPPQPMGQPGAPAEATAHPGAPPPVPPHVPTAAAPNIPHPAAAAPPAVHPSPPPVMHAAPQPQPQVFHPQSPPAVHVPQPAPQPHPVPQPQPQAQAHFQPPPAPVHQAPPPAPHPAPAPMHVASAPAHPSAPPPPQREKRPGEH